MSDISQRIETISSKLHRISERLKELERQNASISADKAAMDAERREDKRKIAELTENYNRIKLAKHLVHASGDKVEMKFKVNELVREIDKCIALLNR